MSTAVDGPAGYAIVIAVSLLASVGVTLAFSLAIVGAVRAADARRARRRAGTVAWAALALLAILLVGMAIGLGLSILAG